MPVHNTGAGFDPKKKVRATTQTQKTVFCLALEGNAVTGSDWFYKKDDRDNALGKSGAENEIPFELEVPFHADRQEITDLVDAAAWDKTHKPEIKPQRIVFFNIDWDTEREIVPSLPTTCEADVGIDTDVNTEGADVLSDKFGYCVRSFSWSANIKHPYTDYCLANAISLVNAERSLNIEPPAASLVQAREIVKSMVPNFKHNWLTGAAALDVLDAAIDGVDLKECHRL